MAIFAKKHDGKRAARKLDDYSPVDSIMASKESDPESSDDAADVAGDLAGASPGSDTGIEPEVVIPPATVDPVVTAQVVGSGVVEPLVVESLEIEPEVIEPEALEATSDNDEGRLAFGIGDAIRLMRSLPSDPNVDLVVRVVRVTLGAVNVSVEEILQDAAKKERAIQATIAGLQGDVETLEKALYAKRCEIAAHESDLKETVTVRERLHMADKYTGHRPPPTPADATKPHHSTPKSMTFDATSGVDVDLNSPPR